MRILRNLTNLLNSRRYSEPPMWYYATWVHVTDRTCSPLVEPRSPSNDPSLLSMPLSQDCLGVVLRQAGRHAEAIQV